MADQSQAFLRILHHPFKFRMFLLTKLPSAFFSGVRVIAMDKEKCRVRVPYKWFTRNPFRSTYFACLSMAAEMSTGVLALSYVYERKPSVSMLVVKMEGNYFKKAGGSTDFVCEEGAGIGECIERAVRTGEAQTITVKSLGTNEHRDKIAEFYLTWSFKARTSSR